MSETGNFFAIDRTSFYKTCQLGMNAAVAYLVLANFSLGNNQTTKAGVNAIERYTNISRSRGKEAIEDLIEARLLERKNETKKQRWPIYHICFDRNEADFIWLPKELIQAAKNEISPVELIRRRLDISLLLLLIELYHNHELIDDGGVDSRLIFMPHDRETILEKTVFTIYGFNSTNEMYLGKNIKKLDRLQNQHNLNTDDIFEKIKTLISLGLISWHYHLFEGCLKKEEPEILHPLGTYGSDFIEHENELRHLAFEASMANLHEGPAYDAEDKFKFIIPVQRKQTNPMVYGILRLRYRPKTKKTGKWMSNLINKYDEFKLFYKNLQHQ